MEGTNITVINLEELKLLDRIYTPVIPRHIVKDSFYFYTSFNLANLLAKIDLTNKKVIKKVNTGKMPRITALLPDFKYIFVVNYESETMSVRTRYRNG